LDKNGVHADAGGQSKHDSKLGGHVQAGVGIGVNVNLSQASRAYSRTVASIDSAVTAVGTLIRAYIPGIN
jgi:hypothetical protein